MRKSFPFLKLFMFLTTILLSTTIMAQSGTIKGYVKNENGPVANATVTLQGKNIATKTNESGMYELKAAPGSYNVVISYVGVTPYLQSVIVTAGQTTTLDATLASASTQGEDIVLVGTRSSPRSKLQTPVPVDVVTAKELKSFAQLDVAQALNYIAPSFQSARQTVSDGTDHIDPAGLRGLGPDQTLVLVNGKRRHNTALVNINGTVGRGSVGTDLNAIPAAAIERIEVLRDGAAAQYGSDAIAGVINIVLKKKYNAFNVSTTYGANVTNMPYQGGQKIRDGKTGQIDWSFGKAGNWGGFVFSGQLLDRDRSDRSGTDNIPLIFLGNGGGFPAPPSGVTPLDFRKWMIDEDAKIVAQRRYNRRNVVVGNSGQRNLGLFINGDFKVDDNSSFYYTVGTGNRTGIASGFSRNPNSWAQQPITSTGDYYYTNGFLPEIHTKIKDNSVILGFKTKLDNGLNLDVSNTSGGNSIFFDIKNSGNASATPRGAVQTEFDAGGLKFKQNTFNLDLSKNYNVTGLKGLNVAVGGEFRSENFEIVKGEEASYTNYNRKVIVPGLPVFYPGTTTTIYPVSPFATGSALPDAGAGAQVFPGFGPADAINKKRNIIAGYADVDMDFKGGSLGLAGRYEKYSDFGSGFGGKLTGRVELAKDISVRGSVNVGFRAPSLHQRYFQNTSTQFVGGLPSQSLTANNDNVLVRDSFGIESLSPEKSLGFALGFVAKLGSKTTLTIDGYNINIKDRIVLSTAFSRSGNPRVAAILQNVPSSVNVLQFFTNAIDTRTTGIDFVLSHKEPLQKGASLNLSVAANYNKNTQVGTLNTNSKIDDAINNPSTATGSTANPEADLKYAIFDRQQKSRLEVAQPLYKINFTIGYSNEKFDVTVRPVIFGKTQYVHNVNPNAVLTTGALRNDLSPLIDQTYKAKTVTDMVVNYKPGNGVVFTLGANNIFDIYPDRTFIDPRNDQSAVYANPINGANGAPGGYGAGRDVSNRGRFLFNPNQFGYNGRFLFARMSVDINQIAKSAWWKNLGKIN